MGKTHFEQVPLDVVKRIVAPDPREIGAGRGVHNLWKPTPIRGFQNR
jgi:hypothetical protein